MISIDGPISFLVGGALVLARRRPDGEVPARNRLLAKGLLFQSSVLTPLILFYLVRFPDWEWNYLFDARAFFFDAARPTLGFACLSLVVACVNASFYVGFRVTEALVARGHVARAKRLVFGTIALVLLTMALMLRQTLHVGSYAEFAAGEARLIFVHVEWLVVTLGGGLLIALGLASVLGSERRCDTGNSSSTSAPT